MISITLLFSIVPLRAKEQKNPLIKTELKILFLSGTNGFLNPIDDTVLGVIDEIKEKNNLAETIKLKKIYLEIEFYNSNTIIEDYNPSDLLKKIKRYNPNFLITLDNSSFIIISSIEKELPDTKIICYNLSEDSEELLKDIRKEEFSFYELKTDIDYSLFFNLIKTKIITTEIFAIVTESDFSYAEKSSHYKASNLSRCCISLFNKRCHILPVETFSELKGKIIELDKKFKSVIIFNLVDYLRKNSTQDYVMNPSEINLNLSRILSSNSLLVTMNYRNTLEGKCISFGPNYYTDGRKLTNLIIDINNNKTVSKKINSSSILVFNLKNSNRQYYDVFRTKMALYDYIFFY